jgi:xylulokinase
MSLMGVDVGTSSCKAVAFNFQGKALASASREYQPVFLSRGRVEAEPETFWRAATAAIAEAAAQTKDDPVEALAISSHGESFMPVDARGQALSPWILNADTRAAEEVGDWEARFGRDRTFAITGTVVQPAFPLLKLQWLRKHEAQLFASAARFVSVVDSILLQMGLPPYLDYSLASRFLMFDVRRHRWSEPILGAAGLSPECLPIPVAAGTVAGPLSSQAAAQLGLRPGTPVVVGGHDQASGALGMGAIEPGMVSDSMGTYECLVHVDGAPRLDDAALAANLNSYCHVVPDRYITIAYFPSGIMLQWYRDTFGSGPVDTRAGADLFARAEELAPSSPTGLCVLPHLIGSATPHFDVRATGVILGLTPNADGPTIFKGILEGIASELAIVSDLLAGVVGPFDTIRASGGGARSSLGMRLRAALTGRRIHLLESPESVCLGAALLAGAAVGVYSDLTQAVANTVRVVDTIEPDAELAAAYAGQLRQYRLLYPALAPVREAKSGESDD